MALLQFFFQKTLFEKLLKLFLLFQQMIKWEKISISKCEMFSPLDLIFCYLNSFWQSLPERIYNPITAMGFSPMFTFQLDNTKR